MITPDSGIWLHTLGQVLSFDRFDARLKKATGVRRVDP